MENNGTNKKTHLTWYFKLNLTDDISIRYYLVFEDRRGLERKWVIKSHSTKEYGIIDSKAVKLIINSHNKDLKDAKEIIGRADNKADYKKIVLNSDYVPQKIKLIVEESNADNPEKVTENSFNYKLKWNDG